jgi:hypothetical protein
MSADPRMAEIEGRLRSPVSVEDVRDVLSLLDGIAAGGGGVEVDEAIEVGFRNAVIAFRELTESEPKQAVNILLDDLLSRCLIADRPGENDYSWFLSYGFGEWVNELPEVERREVRTVALPRAMEAFEGPAVRNALRLMAAVGYWDEDILAAHDRLASERADIVGDQALSCRASLCIPKDKLVLDAYLEKLHGRIPSGPNRHLSTACRILGTRKTAELVWDNWLNGPVRSDADSELFTSIALSLLAEIAAREGDPEFTTWVWDCLVELSRRPTTRKLEHVFSMNSSLVNRLDVSAAVPELLRLAANSDKHRHLYFRRALECQRPAHMAGWDYVDSDDLAVVRHESVAPSGMTGHWVTGSLLNKEAAWDVLLCHGNIETLPSFQDTIAGEIGGVADRFLELAACLGLAPLPEPVGKMLAGTFDTKWDDHGRLIAQIGAIQAAHGAGTAEAFAALLGYRPVGERGVLLSAIDALADTAGTLARGGDRSQIEQLLAVAEDSIFEYNRAAAVGAVAQLLEGGVLTHAERTRAFGLLMRPTTDAHARRQLLYAVATLALEDIGAAAWAYTAEVLASSSGDDTGRVRDAAANLLARRPASRQDPAFLAKYVGLVDRGGTLFPTEPRPAGPVAPHVLGRFFATEPERFGPAVADWITARDEMAAFQLLPFVRGAAASTPAVVTDALLARLRSADRGHTFEPEILRTLAAVAPERLLVEGCEAVAAWLPQARADLADTVGKLPTLDDSGEDARFPLLTHLAVDSVYAVRRAAYRAATGCAVNRFLGLVASWAAWPASEGAGPRRYAAESIGWLPPEVVATKIASLEWDPEPAVREAFRRSIAERDDRRNAAEFERSVLSVSDAAGVIRAWRYGIALGRVGDDETSRYLTARWAETAVPPAVRYWLKRVQKSVEERWAGVTRKWPEPWYTRRGSLARFAGTVHIDSKVVPVTGTLWLLGAESPDGLSSWGGWGEFGGTWDLFATGTAELRIPGLPSARVLVTSSRFPRSEMVFSGNSPYPRAVSDTVGLVSTKSDDS